MKLVREGDAYAVSMGHRRHRAGEANARFGVQVVLAAGLANLMSGTVAGMLV